MKSEEKMNQKRLEADISDPFPQVHTILHETEIIRTMISHLNQKIFNILYLLIHIQHDFGLFIKQNVCKLYSSCTQ